MCNSLYLATVNYKYMHLSNQLPIKYLSGSDSRPTNSKRKMLTLSVILAVLCACDVTHALTPAEEAILRSNGVTLEDYDADFYYFFHSGNSQG